MKNINRDITPIIERWLFKNKIIIIYGARQVGKTTLVKKLLEKYGDSGNYFNCDIIHIRNSFNQQDPVTLKRIVGDARLIVLDEAQRIEDIGMVLKILHDTYPNIQIIATGSSSFDLSNKTKEPLTGRSLEFILHPFSLRELLQIYSPIELINQIEQLVIYGLYPEIVMAPQADARRLLDNLTDKYLYKDIFEFEALKKSSVIVKLLQLIAFQISNEVSLHELATSLGINRKTVERYLDLLEKTFVIFRLKSFSRNLRKELLKKEKIYFYDVGIRNSIIAQLNPLPLRNDKGALWENFCISERLKLREYSEKYGHVYFWRTHDQKEIDFIEESEGVFTGYEFKWEATKYKPPKDFINTYKNSSVNLITKNNFWEFLVDAQN